MGRDHQLNRFVDRLFGEWDGRPLANLESFTPGCEVTESKDNYTVKVDLPGIPKDKIKIDLHEGQLTISGERREEKTGEGDSRHFSEVTYGSFMRTLTFPTAVESDKVNAKYQDGVLTITVPKSEKSRARQITVQ
jgi:HSP20 family protein